MTADVAGRPVVRADQVTLGVLVSEVPRDAVDDAVAVCGVREQRLDGKLPAHVTAYLTLGLVLFPDDDYTEVAAKVTGSLDRFGCWNAGWSVPTSSAITQARKRLGRKLFAELFANTCGPVAGRAGPTAAMSALGTARGRSCADGGCWPSTGSRPICLTVRRTRPSSATPGPETTGQRCRRPGWWRWPSAAPTRSSPRRSAPTTPVRRPSRSGCTRGYAPMSC